MQPRTVIVECCNVNVSRFQRNPQATALLNLGLTCCHFNLKTRNGRSLGRNLDVVIHDILLTLPEYLMQTLDGIGLKIRQHLFAIQVHLTLIDSIHEAIHQADVVHPSRYLNGIDVSHRRSNRHIDWCRYALTLGIIRNPLVNGRHFGGISIK